MKHTLLSLCFLLISWASIGQISYEKRIEFELKERDSYNDIIEFGERGILKCKSDGLIGITLTFELYDTNLELIKSNSISTGSTLYRSHQYKDDQYVYFLFYNRHGSYELITLNATTLATTKIKGAFSKKARISKFVVTGNRAFVQASIKREPALYSINLKTAKQELIPIQITGVITKKIKLQDLQVIPNTKELFLSANANINNADRNLYAIILNERGEQKEVTNLTKNTNKIILNATASKLENGKYIFTGTYSNFQSKLDLIKNQFENSGRFDTETSVGLYFCQAGKSKVDFIKFHNFLELKNFLNYLPKEEQVKIKNTQYRKEQNGKELTLNYRLAIHNITQIQNGYLFIGEAYYATYHNETEKKHNSQLNIDEYKTTQVFDGYQYTHAIIGKFDQNGALVWDHIFEMNTTQKPKKIQKFINIQEQDTSNIQLAFSSKAKIFTKKIDFNGKVIRNVNTEKIQMSYNGDQEKLSTTYLHYWYDNYFIVYGEQTIKNKEGKKVKKKRKVYFVSKIKYE